MSDVTFIRNKIVTVEEQDSETFLVRGLLADDIYGLEIQVSIHTSTMSIQALTGQWNRWTTPECHRAIAMLQEAVGSCILDNDFSQKIKKTVGRISCRHFANLLLECCDSAREAAGLERTAGQPVETAGKAGSQPPSGRKGPSEHGASLQAAGGGSGGYVIDLHVHSYPASPCSSASVDDLIEEAKRIGLDGICLTDHHHRWSPDELARLQRKHAFLILGGNEVTTDQGDILVFGVDRDFPDIITIQELREEAGPAAFLIAAHPFRGFLTFGVGQLGLTSEKAMQRPLFRYVDGVEVLNGKVTEKENRFSAEVAGELGLPVTGGSDAHEVSEVGLYATRFEEAVHNETELVAALKTGRCMPVIFRGKP